MPELSPTAAHLLMQLEVLAEQAPNNIYACVYARREHGIRSARLNQRVLAVVLHGCKHLRGNGFDMHRQRGQAFVITRATQCDAFNWPAPESGLYRTLMLPLCDEVLAAARLLRMQPATPQGAAIVGVSLDDLHQELNAWVDGMHRGDATSARLALTALVLRLCTLGHTQVLAPAPPTLADAIREQVSTQPERNWRSADFEAALALSGATLRRRLSAENTTLSDTITEARLTHAMQLLYTTRWPIKTVAARSGYRSVSSFSQRFRQRYGLEPAAIGNAGMASDVTD